LPILRASAITSPQSGARRRLAASQLRTFELLRKPL